MECAKAAELANSFAYNDRVKDDKERVEYSGDRGRPGEVGVWSVRQPLMTIAKTETELG